MTPLSIEDSGGAALTAGSQRAVCRASRCTGEDLGMEGCRAGRT
jgi:hypothetical protein